MVKIASLKMLEGFNLRIYKESIFNSFPNSFHITFLLIVLGNGNEF